MTVAELLERMSSKEITEWMELEKLEPFKAEVPYLGSAIVAQTVANFHKGKGQQAYKTKDFMPDFKPKKPQTTEEMIGLAEQITAFHGGKDKRE